MTGRGEAIGEQAAVAIAPGAPPAGRGRTGSAGRLVRAGLAAGLAVLASLWLIGLAGAPGRSLRDLNRILEARSFLVLDGVGGPYSASRPFPSELLPEGVEPIGLTKAPVGGDPERTVRLVGVDPSGPLFGRVESGRRLSVEGQALASPLSGLRVGDDALIGDERVEVVGSVAVPGSGSEGIVVVDLATYQSIAHQGLNLVSAGVVPAGVLPGGVDATAPAGLTTVSPDAAVSDGVADRADTRRGLGRLVVIVGALGAVVAASALRGAGSRSGWGPVGRGAVVGVIAAAVGATTAVLGGAVDLLPAPGRGELAWAVGVCVIGGALLGAGAALARIGRVEAHGSGDDRLPQ